MLHVHAFLPLSYANGPGPRCVLWLQGCTLACPGCFNPQTHSKAWPAAEHWSVDDAVARVDACDGVEGLTLSGGEPLQQAEAVATLLSRVRAETPLSVLLFTGYTWAEIQRDPARRQVLDHCDVVVAGRYLARKAQHEPLRSSTNQQVYRLTDRYTEGDLHTVPETELVIQPDGQVTISGTAPPVRL